MKMKKLARKILSLTTVLALSVSAMAFTMTASAVEYNGKEYDYIIESVEKDSAMVFEEGKSYCITSDAELFPESADLGKDCTIDVYGKFNICETGVYHENVKINVYSGYVYTFVFKTYSDTADCSLDVTIYGGDYFAYFDPPASVTVNYAPKSFDQNTTEAADKQSTFKVNATAIGEPTYTVTIPETVEFGDIEKKLSTADDKTKEINFDIQCAGENLAENEKQVDITLSTADFKITKADSTETLSYSLYRAGENKADTTKPIAAGDKILTVNGTTATKTETCYAQLDQSKITAAGDYAGTMTFTVSMTDEEAE